MIKYNEQIGLQFKNYSQLSFKDLGEDSIQLFLDNESVGMADVWTDVGNQNREYIIINNEIIYLDTIKHRI